MSRNLAVRLAFLVFFAALAPLGSACGTAEKGKPDVSTPDAGTPDEYVEHTRKVVIARPWAETGFDQVPVWEVLDLLEDGTLVWPQPRVTFEMGIGSSGNVVFTPDGKYGVASQKDGCIGIFTFDKDGRPRVIKAAWRGPDDNAFYSSAVVMDPSGKRFYVVDNNWTENGGGIYSVKLGDDGEPTFEGKVFSSKLGALFGFLPNAPGLALYHSAEIPTLSVPQGNDFHLLKWGGVPGRLASASTFSDSANASVSAMSISPDGAWALVANSPFTEGQTGRIAVVSVAQEPPALEVVHYVEGVKNPSALAWSPYGNVAVALENFGDAIKVLPFDASEAEPLSLQGNMTYSSDARALPQSIHVIDKGRLRGRMLVSELRGVRQVQFHPDGTVEDLGLMTLIEGLKGNEIIVRLMGVQP